jgi:uncharacterized membrane protein
VFEAAVESSGGHGGDTELLFPSDRVLWFGTAASQKGEGARNGHGRSEGFSDGVLATIITIMVLEAKAPEGFDLAAIHAALWAFLVYALSYFNVGIVWNNHHHILHATGKINGPNMWLNLFLLFWVSLIPLLIRWMNEAHFASQPTAEYGVVLAMVTIAYVVFEKAIIALSGPDSKLAAAIGTEWKGLLTLGIYLVGIFAAFVSPALAIGLYVAAALLWFLPDRRIERIL